MQNQSMIQPRDMWRAQLRSLLRCCLKVAALLLFAPAVIQAESGTALEKPAPKAAVESELITEGLVSYGNYRIFASGTGFKLFTSGFEYDRHSWGYFLRARVDYVAELLPFVLLQSPTATAPWGAALTKDRKLIPGVGISPIGFKMIWRDGKAIKPYLLAKGGMLGFDEKVLAKESTYEDFSLQSTGGIQVRLSPKVDLRLGLFGDFHFSNAFMVPINPGLDVMNANFGVSYHLEHDRH